MSRDTRPRIGSSDFCSTLTGGSVNSDSITTRSRAMTLSGSQFVDSGLGLEESARFNSFNTDVSSDHARITMKTRVAVRDKNPHRFQVVPLRDASKLQATGAAIPPATYLFKPLSGKRPPCSQSRLLYSSRSSQSDLGNPRKENRHWEEREQEINTDKTLSSSKSKTLTRFPPPLSSIGLHPQEYKISVFNELNMNCDRPVAQKPEVPPLPLSRSSNELPHIGNLPSRNPLSAPAYSDLPHPHTTRPLHQESRQGKNYPRFTSLSDFKNLTVAQGNLVPESTSIRNNIKIAEEPNCLSSSPNVYHKSQKRHAIYTTSLFLPYFDPLEYYSEARLNDDVEQPFPEPSLDEQAEPVVNTPFELDADQTLRQEIRESTSTSSATNHQPFKPDGSELVLSFESPLHHSSPKALASVLYPARGLNYSKHLCIETKRSLNPGNVLYPLIVLDLFVEIDTAIKEWKTCTPLSF